jgi:hypothetical protein
MNKKSKRRVFKGIVLSSFCIALTNSAVRAGSVPTDFKLGGLGFDFTQGAGPWNYGQFTSETDPNSFKNFPTLTTLASTVAGQPDLLEYYTGAADPNVIYNPGASATYPQYGSETFAAGTVNLGPKDGPSVVRFTVPYTDTFDISATFTPDQVVNSDPDAFVYVGSPTGTQVTLGQPYSDLAVSLTKNEEIYFVVDPGSSNTNWKLTQLSADISLAPGSFPPSAVPLPKAADVGFWMLGGFGALAAIRKRLGRSPRIA